MCKITLSVLLEANSLVWKLAWNVVSSNEHASLFWVQDIREQRIQCLTLFSLAFLHTVPLTHTVHTIHILSSRDTATMAEFPPALIWGNVLPGSWPWQEQPQLPVELATNRYAFSFEFSMTWCSPAVQKSGALSLPKRSHTLLLNASLNFKQN